jgi:hypothetical protein
MANKNRRPTLKLLGFNFSRTELLIFLVGLLAGALASDIVKLIAQRIIGG